MFNLFLIIVTTATFGALYYLFDFLLKQRKKLIKKKQIKLGDIVMLEKKYSNHYPNLPQNNPFTVVGFNNSRIEIRYIHFKKKTIHHEVVERQALRKVS